MPLVILDGPEASGKSTIIDALMEEWGLNSRLRSWGPRESWLEYCQPLFEDGKAVKEDPHLLIVWSRSWLSRMVYNRLLNQGQSVPPRATSELDNIVIASGGLLLLILSPPKVLIDRRLTRVAAGEKKDHPLDPRMEHTQFDRCIRHRKWRVLSGTIDPEDNVRTIITMLVQRNPECRMSRSLMVVGEETPLERLFTN
jgi:hypothetical protein